ncbi:Hypothetical protein NTJ_15575 [Nesidiocoris tenuis]|uniref:Uncharacterized protein n=1 Tax=Nesidiocoris tenuis TaxID=355587 RepID=A0ABN7BEJ6_9HEMI|nr:Hypothetical protein NTJ_15575 [Nesidiocoris tenuis]
MHRRNEGPILGPFEGEELRSHSALLIPQSVRNEKDRHGSFFVVVCGAPKDLRGPTVQQRRALPFVIPLSCSESSRQTANMIIFIRHYVVYRPANLQISRTLPNVVNCRKLSNSRVVACPKSSTVAN